MKDRARGIHTFVLIAVTTAVVQLGGPRTGEATDPQQSVQVPCGVPQGGLGTAWQLTGVRALW